jgi:hypothetical protein
MRQEGYLVPLIVVAVMTEVDLPVEEFFFRVDPAVEHLLMQVRTGSG